MRQHLENDAQRTRNISFLQTRGGGLRQRAELSLARRIPLYGGNLRLVGGSGKPARERQDQGAGCSDGNPMSSSKLAGAIRHAVRLSLNDIAAQEAPDIFTERIGGCIPLGRRLLQRLDRDVIQVAS